MLSSDVAAFNNHVADWRSASERIRAKPPDRIVEVLRNGLREALESSGAWCLPTKYVSASGRELTWDDEPERDELLNDLAQQVYVDVVLRSKPVFEQRNAGGQLSGPYIMACVTRWLTRQRQRQDPLGTSVFHNLRDAVEMLIADNRILATPAGALIHYAVLTLPEVSPEGAPARSSRPALRRAISGWPINFAELQFRSAQQQRLLAVQIPTLGEHHIRTFRFGDVNGELTDIVRFAAPPWVGRIEAGTRVDADKAEFVPPCEDAESEAIRRLSLQRGEPLAEVLSSIEHLKRTTKKKDALRAVVREVVRHETDPAAATDGRSLASRLGGAPQTVSDQLKLLNDLVDANMKGQSK
jgi:hypothetical protein